MLVIQTFAVLFPVSLFLSIYVSVSVDKEQTVNNYILR